MDEQQRRISEDLGGMIDGEIRCNPLATAMYASDGSLYQIRPIGVAFPRSENDVCTIARYAGETELPLIPRGAGSGIAGNCLGSGLVVDFSRYMHSVISLNSDTVQVQPGIVRAALNRILRTQGRYFPPDPSNSAVTTIGGMLGTDAAGSHAVRVGSTRDHIERLNLVLPSGELLDAGCESIDFLNDLGPGAESAGSHESQRDPFRTKRTIVSKLAKLLRDHQMLIDRHFPVLPRNTSGYFLRDILIENRLDLPRFLAGSEGTLGLFTSATLHTAPLPAFRGVILLLFGQLEAALRTVQAIAQTQPSACDLLDRRLLSLARESDERFSEMISPAAEAALLVEQTGYNDREVRDRIRGVVSAVRSVQLRSVVAAEGYSEEEVESIWSLPTKVVPLLAQLPGPTRPLPFIEDIAVPPEKMHETLVRIQKVLQRHRVTASLYAHASVGQIHLRPFKTPPISLEQGRSLKELAEDVYHIVWEMGGTVSGEHGDGLSRTSFLRRQYGPLYGLFQQVKMLFDPHNLMNPGKILGDDDDLMVRHFRPPATASDTVTTLQLVWSPQQLADETNRCNGCGDCKTSEPDLRMCPFHRLEPQEAHAPRAKANVLRNLNCGQVAPELAASLEMKQALASCFNCKQCQSECPSQVDIPRMVVESKAQWVAANGLTWNDWILSRAHSFGPIGSTMSLATNWMMANPSARWLIEKSLGIARLRKLPRFSRRPFLRSAGAALTTLPTNRDRRRGVVYFVGDYANYHDPELAWSLVNVLRHHGIRTYVPKGQTGSGMAMISAGDLDAAREVAMQNIRTFGELARDGFDIICTEPTAALCLQQEYAYLVDHPDLEHIAERTIEAGTYLHRLRERGDLKTDFDPLPINVGYHLPCHLKSLIGQSYFADLLALIPELNLHRIDEGCSGMAGAFGLTAANFRTSIRIGWNLIRRMRADDLNVGCTECSSCKAQMEQGTDKPTIHPLKLLALSYGLMPGVRQKLTPTKQRLVVS